MARYVDVELVRPRMCELITAVLDLLGVDSLDSDNEESELINTANDLCDAVPTADVALVVHGHWVREYLGYGARYKCSACGGLFGEDAIDDFEHNRYCSDCGAKMDGKDGERE